MRFYIPVSWLQAIHYYYFAIGIFSFASAIVFLQFPEYAIFFIVSYILNTGMCFYLSWWVHKRVSKDVIFDYRKYIRNHLLIAVITVGLLAAMMYLNFARELSVIDIETRTRVTFNMIVPEFVDIIIGFNYFTFFMALTWSIALKFDFFSKVFSTYNRITLQRAKEYASLMRKKLGTGWLITSEKFKSYRIGQDNRIDAILMEVWNYRKSHTLKISMMKLELAFCDYMIADMTRRVSVVSKRHLTEGERKLVENYQKTIDKYAKNSYVYRKRTEQEEEKLKEQM